MKPDAALSVAILPALLSVAMFSLGLTVMALPWISFLLSLMGAEIKRSVAIFLHNTLLFILSHVCPEYINSTYCFFMLIRHACIHSSLVVDGI